MKCDDYEALFTGWLNKDLTPEEQEKMKLHLSSCASCAKELAAKQQIWEMMGSIETPEPSAAMRHNFNAMLKDYKTAAKEDNSLVNLLKRQLENLK